MLSSVPSKARPGRNRLVAKHTVPEVSTPRQNKTLYVVGQRHAKPLQKGLRGAKCSPPHRSPDRATARTSTPLKWCDEIYHNTENTPIKTPLGRPFSRCDENLYIFLVYSFVRRWSKINLHKEYRFCEVYRIRKEHLMKKIKVGQRAEIDKDGQHLEK